MTRETPITISEIWKPIERFNPISGHRWTEQGKTIGYKVRGGGWLPTEHRTLAAAEKEKALREQILHERR